MTPQTSTGRLLLLAAGAAAAAIAAGPQARAQTAAPTTTTVAATGTPSQTSLDARKEAARLCEEAKIRPSLLADCTGNTAAKILNAQAAASDKIIACKEKLKAASPEDLLAAKTAAKIVKFTPDNVCAAAAKLPERRADASAASGTKPAAAPQ